MGRNKIDIQFIKDDRIRNVNIIILSQYLLFLEPLQLSTIFIQITFNKRKNGLLKKACELAVLCNVKMLLCFTDLNSHVYQFQSPLNSEMELIQSRHKKSFTKVDYPAFQRKRNSASQSPTSSVEQRKQKIDPPQNMQLRHKIIDHIEKQEIRKQVKMEEQPNKNEDQKKRALVKKKNEEIVVNEFIVQQPQYNFEDLYQFGNYNTNEAHSDSGSQQEYRQNKLMKLDSLVNGNNVVNDSQQMNLLSQYYSKDRMVLNENIQILTSQNNSRMQNPVQFIVPPQSYLGMNPSPIVQPLNKVFVGEVDMIDGPVVNDGFKKYTK